MKIMIPWSEIEKAAAQRGPTYMDEVRAVAQTDGEMCIMTDSDYNAICDRHSLHSGLSGIPLQPAVAAHVERQRGSPGCCG